MMYQDRIEAGARLAEALEKYRGTDALVFAIPRGGVVIGYQVAKALGAHLDVIIPRKIGAPGQPELAIGAIGHGVSVIDEETVRYLHVSEDYIRSEIERQKQEIERRWKLYRDDRPFPDIEGKNVILVDDGMATGHTTMAAARTLRARKPGKLVLAVPVAPPESVYRLRKEVDELIVLQILEPFYSVGSWYERFDQTTDEEVMDLLKRSEAGTRE